MWGGMGQNVGDTFKDWVSRTEECQNRRVGFKGQRLTPALAEERQHLKTMLGVMLGSDWVAHTENTLF